MYIQYYNSYIREDNTENYERCFITRICGKLTDYSSSNYLKIVESPFVRNIITRLRLDCNKLNDCRFRSYRFSHCTSNLCPDCPNSVQSVSHLILHCNKPSIVTLREKFFISYTKINRDFRYFSDNDKLSHLLNIPCRVPEATHVVCSYLKQLYKMSGFLYGGN